MINSIRDLEQELFFGDVSPMFHILMLTVITFCTVFLAVLSNKQKKLIIRLERQHIAANEKLERLFVLLSRWENRGG